MKKKMNRIINIYEGQEEANYKHNLENNNDLAISLVFSVFGIITILSVVTYFILPTVAGKMWSLGVFAGSLIFNVMFAKIFGYFELL